MRGSLAGLRVGCGEYCVCWERCREGCVRVGSAEMISVYYSHS